MSQANILATDIMVPRKKLVTLSPDDDALSAIRLLLSRKISGAPVVDKEKRFLGVFSEKTSMQFLIRLNYDSLPSSRVEAFMNTDRDRTVDGNVDLLSILEIFLKTPYRRLPVLEGEELIGQISRRDALQASTKALESVVAIDRQVLYLSALADRKHESQLPKIS